MKNIFVLIHFKLERFDSEIWEKVVMKVSRLIFLTRRIVESPFSFLVKKLLIEVGKLYLLPLLHIDKVGIITLGNKNTFEALFSTNAYKPLQRIDGF